MQAELAAGVIWAFFCGAALGNLATNPMFRLPRHLPVTKEKPFCDSCHTPLTPRDLFPIFSWLVARGRCRSCAAPIPSSYFWLELGFAVLHVTAFLAFGFGEWYLLLTTAVGACFLAAAMQLKDRYLSWATLAFVVVPGWLWAALRDGTLTGPLHGVVLTGGALIVGMYLEREKQRFRTAAHWLRHGLAGFALAPWIGPETLSWGLVAYLSVYFLTRLRWRGAEHANGRAILAVAAAILTLALRGAHAAHLTLLAA